MRAWISHAIGRGSRRCRATVAQSKIPYTVLFRRGSCAPSPGSNRYVVEEELLDHSPAAHVHRPRLDYESHATALDPNDLGALLVAAGLSSAHDHALMSLLG